MSEIEDLTKTDINNSFTITYNDINTMPTIDTACAGATREICEAPNDLNNEVDFISAVIINGKKYKLRCEIIEVHPLTCTKCGSPLELHNGHGKCEYCGTSYSAIMSIVEDK